MPKPIRDLQVEQNLEFQHWEWFFQRLGRVALALFILAAALGLFGSGPLNRARAEIDGKSLWAEYDRFPRVGASSRLKIHVGTTAVNTEAREIQLNRSYFDNIRIERITPEPDRIVVEADQVRLIYESGGAPLAIGGHHSPGFSTAFCRKPADCHRYSTVVATRILSVFLLLTTEIFNGGNITSGIDPSLSAGDFPNRR